MSFKYNTGVLSRCRTQAGLPKGCEEVKHSKVEDEVISKLRKGEEDMVLAQLNKKFVMEEEVEEEVVQ